MRNAGASGLASALSPSGFQEAPSTDARRADAGECVRVGRGSVLRGGVENGGARPGRKSAGSEPALLRAAPRGLRLGVLAGDGARTDAGERLRSAEDGRAEEARERSRDESDESECKESESDEADVHAGEGVHVRGGASRGRSKLEEEE